MISSTKELIAHPLPTSGKLIIGRADDCTVVIDDTSLSRHHAALWVFGEEIAIEDLGSRNGTRVGDHKLAGGERRRVHVGEVISAGNATLLLRDVPFVERSRRLLSHSQLELFLESECARAAHGGQPFGLVRVDLGDGVALDPGRAAGAERACAMALQPSDLFAHYAPGCYELLLLGADPAAASARLEALRSALVEIAPARLAVAVFPTDGRTADELIAATIRASLPAADQAKEPIVRNTLGEVAPAVRRIARSEINVIITGETGVGKDVVAQTLHRLSPRAKRPLVSLNCAAFSETLLEGELFGHERGAFTGAHAEKVGLLESADGGTVFLDEIAEMPLSSQAKLLRVVETKQVQRVGAVRPRAIDVRFLAATHRDLEAEVTAGRFREDLLFRLNGISLVVLPLRERVAEIEPLAELFLRQAAERGGVAMPQLPEETRALLRSYRWPGNVREVRNVMERALVLSTDAVIRPNDLPLEKMRARTIELTVPATAPRPERRLDRRDPTVRAGSRDDERVQIVAALAAADGNREAAARILGISRRTLINRMDEYDLPRGRKR